MTRPARLSLLPLEDRLTPTTLTLTAPSKLTYSPLPQTLNLSVALTDPAGTVKGGTVTFTALRASLTPGGTPVGTPVTVPVANGAAQGKYTLPALAPVGLYTVRAAYSGADGFTPGTPSERAVTVVPATIPGKGSGGTGGMGGGFDPHDPSYVFGPAGVGPKNATRPDADWGYTVEFQNDGRGPAQDVIITGTLDPSLDPATFRFGGFDFGTARGEAPAGQTSYATVVPYHNSDGSPLSVPASFDFDPASGRFRVELHSVDPATGEPVPSPGQHGLLPPDDSTRAGTGHVRFSARPRDGVAAGTEVRGTAAVVFNRNAPETPPAAVNTVAGWRVAYTPAVSAAVAVRAATGDDGPGQSRGVAATASPDIPLAADGGYDWFRIDVVTGPPAGRADGLTDLLGVELAR